MSEQRLWKLASIIAVAAIGLFFWVVFRQAKTGVTKGGLLSSAHDAWVWLEVPETAVAGQPFTARLMAEGVLTLGGFEVMLQFDPAATPLLDAKASADWAGNRQQLFVGSIRLEDGVILGSISCPVANCASIAYADEPRLEATAAKEPMEIAVFEFARREGTALPAIRDMLLIDGMGKVLLAEGQFEADLKNSIEPDLKALDLSENGVINDADAYLVVSAWHELRRNGRCLETTITSYDVNNSGCLTMADAQTILGAWGEWLITPPPLPSTGQKIESTFVVNSQGNQNDINPGNGQCLTVLGTCTFRAAIQEANARPGPDTIHFDIRNVGGSCPNLVTLQPAGGLIIDAPDNAAVTINGYTQCNSSPNNNWIDGNAVIKIELEGSNQTAVYGVHVLSPNNVIKGLAVYNWHRQIQLLGNRAHDNTIEGNFIGTNAANTFTQNAPGLEGDGIRVQLGASNNLIGGNTTAARNIVSGNDQDGVALQGDGVEGNVVINNYVGLRQNGSSSLRNGADGVDVAEGVANNRIGGLSAGERNVISGNSRDGVEISHDADTVGNHIVGNFIGLRPSGNQALSNGERGVTLEDLVTHNFIYRNVIAGNGGDGVRLYTVFDNQIYDNFIGVRPTGMGAQEVVPVPGTEEGLAVMPNGTTLESEYGLSGVYMTGGSRGNSVTHNIIAHHPEHGILLDANKGYLSYGTCETKFNSFSRNSLFNNASTGIKLRVGECEGNPNQQPNVGIDPPQIVSATTFKIVGETCDGCTVELFLADKALVNEPTGDNWGEGMTYLRTGAADNEGQFVIYGTAVAEGAILTAHTTDSNGNSSEFARNVIVISGPPIYRIYLPLIIK